MLKQPKLSALDGLLLAQLALAIVILIAININIIQDTNNAIQQAQLGAEARAKMAAEVFSGEIRHYQNTATLLVREKNTMLHQVLNDPIPDNHIFDLAQIMESWFPKIFAFTLANAQGVPVVSDFTGSIGPECLHDMRHTAMSTTQSIRLHGISSIPHYDIVTPINGTGALLLTFTTKSLQDFLDRNSDPRYDLTYTKLPIPVATTHNNTNIYDVAIEASNINIRAQLAPSYLAEIERQKWRKLIIYNAVFLTFVLFAGVMLSSLRSRLTRVTKK